MIQLNGFGNYLQSEAIPDALPLKQNNPQQAPKGLYAEQLSGSAFTAPRASNLHSWLYRIRPSVGHGEFQSLKMEHWQTPPFAKKITPPNPLRWAPRPSTKISADFLEGLWTYCAHGGPHLGVGAAIHSYIANHSMTERFFYNSDAEMLLIPQEGTLEIGTEFGPLSVSPGEIALIPRGVKFQVAFKAPQVRGYVCENFGHPFKLPERGPIGANSLADERHFKAPNAQFFDQQGSFELVTRFQGECWRAESGHHPLDVVAWHGNYVPLKYDLANFCVINTVSFDHPDPSIFTVLTSPTNTPGVANLDFVIFPPRWMVAENTFRPPYFHRNIMSEFMGLIKGSYDAKDLDFVPGAASIHNAMVPHGPDASSYEKAVASTLAPQYLSETMAFMLESAAVWELSPESLAAPFRDRDYLQCWQNLKSHFKA